MNAGRSNPYSDHWSVKKSLVWYPLTFPFGVVVHWRVCLWFRVSVGHIQTLKLKYTFAMPLADHPTSGYVCTPATNSTGTLRVDIFHRDQCTSCRLGKVHMLYEDCGPLLIIFWSTVWHCLNLKGCGYFFWRISFHKIHKLHLHSASQGMNL